MINDEYSAGEQYAFCGFIEAINAETRLEDFIKSYQLYKKLCNYSYEIGASGGWTALSRAIKYGNFAIVNEILQVGTDRLVHLKTKQGLTPIYCTALCEEHAIACKIAKVLLQKGVKVNQENAMTFSTPLWAALENTKNVALAALLLQHGAIPPPIERLTEIGRNILMQGAAIVSKENKKRALIHLYLKKHLINDAISVIVKLYLWI